MDEDCSICGLELKDKYYHELNCGHKFHYECLMKSFMNNNNKNNYNNCPYCRKESGYLPIVNGLKKLVVGIHCENYQDFYDDNGNHKLKNKPCQYILKKGKNKGKECGKNCYLGYNYCKIHKPK